MSLRTARAAGKMADRVIASRRAQSEGTALDQLGIYGACYKLSILMTLFVQTFRYAAEPWS